MLRLALELVSLLLVPLLLVGVIRKVKALLQNRLGPPVWQPFLDFAKLLFQTRANWPSVIQLRLDDVRPANIGEDVL